jgi:hypothetical protein
MEGLYGLVGGVGSVCGGRGMVGSRNGGGLGFERGLWMGQNGILDVTSLLTRLGLLGSGHPGRALR